MRWIRKLPHSPPAPARLLGWASPAALAILVGCSLTPTEPIDRGNAVGDCRALIQRVDAAVEDAEVADAGSARIEGFPWLRVTRPLASLRDEVDTRERFRAWVDRLAATAQRARGHELANLAREPRRRLQAQWRPAAARHALPDRLDEALPACRDRLRQVALAEPEQRERLRRRATVPDAYNTWQRFFGLYPIAWRIARGEIVEYQAERAEVFATTAPGGDRVQRYAAPADPPRDAARLARDMQRDALGIPAPTAATRARLFAAHAPVWAIETASAADRPGALKLRADGRPEVDPEAPVEYRRLSWTRLGGDILLQLTYQLWFPERPPQGALDPYAGHLDGLLWRVTLGPDGQPIAYDSIHPCGCYYTLLPAPGWRVAEVAPDQEPVASPAQGPRWRPGRRPVVGVEAATHYLSAVATVERPVKARRLAPLQLERLRSLPKPGGGSASAFDEAGLIPSSARLERLFLWPLGVPSAGAMRQWGTHAIAFVGRRHFDDPYLLDRLLERASE